MVSPYLRRPIRTLREVLWSRKAPPKQRPNTVEVRPTKVPGGLLGAAKVAAVRPVTAGPVAAPVAGPVAAPLAGPLVQRQPLRVVAGTAVATAVASATSENDSDRGGD